MKNVFLALVILCGFSTLAYAESCSSGSCGTPVRSGVQRVVSAPVRVVRSVQSRAACRQSRRVARRVSRRVVRSSCYGATSCSGQVVTACSGCAG